jgi:hypothetical protein
LQCSICTQPHLITQITPDGKAGSALWLTHAVSLIIPQSNLVPCLLGRAQNLFPHSCAHAYSRGQEVRSIQVKPVLYFRLENAKNDETDLLPPFSFQRCSLAGRLAPSKGLYHEMNFCEGLVKLVKASKVFRPSNKYPSRDTVLFIRWKNYSMNRDYVEYLYSSSLKSCSVNSTLQHTAVSK